MQVVLLLQVCLLGLGLSGASPGRKFLMMFPPHCDSNANASHQVTITASWVRTSVTVKVLESSFMQHIFLSANQSKTIHLPSSVGLANARSSHLLSVISAQPVAVLASFCTQSGCEHSLLHDVASWGTQYYPVTPNFPKQTAVSQMVITSSDHETSVDIFLSGEVLFNGNTYPRGSVLKLHLGMLQSVYLQSNYSLSGSEVNSQGAVGVVVGYTCSKHASEDSLYGFAELKPVSQWNFDYVIPPLVNTGINSSFLLAISTVSSDLDVTTSTGRKSTSLIAGVVKVIPIVTTDKVHITSDVPFQLIYFRNDNEQRSSTLTALPSVDDICQPVPTFDSTDTSEHQDNSSHTGDFESAVKSSGEPDSPQLPDGDDDNANSSSPFTDVGHYLSTTNQQLFPAVCEKTSCEELHCGHKRKCSIKVSKPFCSLKTKICSAWGDSYYRTFDGRELVLLGNCNYTLVQTTCPGFNASVPLEIIITRAYLNRASVSAIHTVQINVQGFNITMHRERNHVRINGQKRNLPFTVGNGSLNFYPSGSSVLLETSFGLAVQYDWVHHLQVEVGPELYGALCGLCGNANHHDKIDESVIASNGTVDSTLPWVNSDTGTCTEDCSGASCLVCTENQTKSYPGIKGNSFRIDCALLKSGNGPFTDCHPYIDPEPFVRSCVNNQCVSGAASSPCKVLTVYANLCQRLGARVQNWRIIAECPMACPENSHYEVCGSACAATCGNPEAKRNCSMPCVESCQCNRGYLLSGGKCVAPSGCGCVHNDSYYLPEENFWSDEHCQEKCVCQPDSNKVLCAQSHCQAGEVCKVLNGVQGCHMDGTGVCIAKGDPRYTTFDGRNFHVYGNCSYLLTSHCPTWGSLQDFNVEVQNQMKQATNVSFQHVKMLVSGYSIEMSYEWKNKVMVNGLLLSLPSVLSQGKVNLYMTGRSKYIQTDFGLVVTYSSNLMTVQMPRIYSGNLCGLCGNFNANPDDDPMLDDETDLSQAIRQWRTNRRECLDVPTNATGCNPQEISLYQGTDSCGRLLDTEGAFQSCHKTVDPQDFYDNCVSDLCNGNQTTLCQILSGYVDVCQEMGANVDEWRNSSFCHFSCPSNTEYHLCSRHMSDCVENPPAVRCEEGCFCKPGFFHSGGNCVPNSECGCVYDGVYHEIHENFHPDERCQLSCVCVGHNEVQCTNHTCPTGTECAIQKGQRACYASPTVKCTVMGGRHFRTYNGHNFDFNMGSCRYVLSRFCDESEPTVVIQQGRLDISARGVNMSLESEHLGKVKVNGVLRRLPVQLDHIAVMLSGSLTRVVVHGVVITYGGPNLIQIVIPASHTKMCGLCGNASAVATDERQILDENLSNDSVFASSWSLSPPGKNCSEECHNCSVCNSTMAAVFASDSHCGRLLAPAGSFSICHATVDPEPFFQNCVTDLCRSNTEELLCSSLKEYTFACQDAGAEVKPWRGDKCSLPCPEYSHYNVCVGACSESCAALYDVPCPWPCYEGCLCDSGYMQSGNGCVRAEQCGCFYRGHYYKIGETSWAEGCSERCNCSATATMHCESASCLEGESCTLNDTWGCAGIVNNGTCEKEETCSIQSEQHQTVLGTRRRPLTYTLVNVLNDTTSCPANSHYEPCGTACPATCEDPLSSSPCISVCVKGCQCDPGFVLDGDTCVSLSQCGCIHNSHRYHSNQTFWADDLCSVQCVCDPYTHQAQCNVSSCGPDELCGLQDGVRSCVQHAKQTCMYTGRHVVTFDRHDYDFHGTCQYQLLGICGQRKYIDVIQVHVQTDGHLQSSLHVLVSMSGLLVVLNSKNTDSIEVNGVKKNMPYHLSPSAVAFSLGLNTYIHTDAGFVLSLSIEGLISISLSSKYANATCGLCGNFNSDPEDDLPVNGTQEHLSPERFGKAWGRQNPWCVEGCLGGSCPKCSSDHLARYSDPEACGKILEANGPFRHCHSKVDPSSFYKHCVSDLCLYGDLQPALCRSLAEYTAVCLSHKATVYAWRSPGFCNESCPSSTSYNMSSAPVQLCLGWKNNTIQMPPNTGENCLCEAGLVHSGNLCVHPENCGCFYHGEYFRAGQEVSTCQQSCICHPGGHMACHNSSCGEDEECKLISGVQGCHPKAKVAHCSVDGSQYTTFDGQEFEFHGSCNYTLVQTCSLKKLDVEPVLITAQGKRSEGRQIYLRVNKTTFKMSTDFPGKIQVNEVYEDLPFSQRNVTVHKNNEWITVKTPHSVEIISDLRNHIKIKIPKIYHQKTCGLCGNYNDDPSDDMQLPNGTLTSDPDILGPSWKLSNYESSCNDTCDSTCKLCQSPVPEYTSILYCGLLTQPMGPFSSCHRLVFSQKYYSLCMKNLCMAHDKKQALCDALQAYEAACREAGVGVDLWRNTTGCAYQCPQFSHYSRCANVCSSLCPEIRQAVQCPRDCEEGCQCDDQYVYDGHACVPAEQCGCLKDGRRFKPSESKLLQNCTINCTCGPPLVCEPYSCPQLHSCTVSDGTVVCQKNEQNLDPCEGKCDESERCYLSNSVPVCESRPGVCWVWGSRHYHTFDGFDYDLDGTCTYLLAGSKGTSGGLTPFSVSKKNDCAPASSTLVVTVQVYGFVIKLSRGGRVHVNGQVNYIPINVRRGKIEVSYREGKALLKTDFGLQIVFDWNTTVLVTLNPQYKGKVYGLCGNFNADPKDEYAVITPGSPPVKTSVELGQAYRLFDGDLNCCTGCNQKLDEITFDDTVSMYSHDNLCAELLDPSSPHAHCHSRINADSFYQSCMVDLVHNGGSRDALDQAVKSYSIVCEEPSDGYHSDATVDVHCPPNSHYKTCGTACPETCDFKPTFCIKICVIGCFCDPGFIQSPEGCVRPQHCGCKDSRGKHQSQNSTFWIPDNCGQLCVCGQSPGEVTCSPSHCPRGTVCKELHHKMVCQPEEPQNCTLVTGLHFSTFDGHQFDFRDSCAYSLVRTDSNLTGLTPFNITISDASCHKRSFHSLNLKLSIYGLEVVVSKDDPGKVSVDGVYKRLPYTHQTGHIKAFYTPSSIVIHVDVGLELIVYKTGTLMVILPSSYGSSVSGLCGNANADPHDDTMMSNGESAQNTLEFAHSWRLGGADACRSSCTYRLKRCPTEAKRLFEGDDFCGVLLNELGPFAECASVVSPKPYFRSCVADACSYGGHHSALCNSIASYAAACQASQLPVRQWRSDTFCGMSCPKNSHYNLCGPRCPVVCAGLSSPANCSGGCEEGCQCDVGYVLSDDRCVLVSDCGCVHDGQYYLAGSYYSANNCQECNCDKGEVTCAPSHCRPEEGYSSDDGLAQYKPLNYGVCEVLAGFGYITFDGLVLPHHGACTYLVSALSSKAMHDYTLLLSFEKAKNDSIVTVSSLGLLLFSMEVSIDPKTPWKIQVNGEEHSVPFDNGLFKAYQHGTGLTVTTAAGMRLELSHTLYIRLTIPEVHDATASGLCGNFNGDKSDDLELRNGGLGKSIAKFLHSWAVVAPGRNCSETCGGECDQCSLSPEAMMVCDSLLHPSTELNPCWKSGVDVQIYKDVCIRAVCAGAEHTQAVCLGMEAYAAACQAEGKTVGSWRKNTPCSLECPDRSSPSECVYSSSNSCPALLLPGAPEAGCSGSCQCLNGNVFDGNDCVPYSECGCVLHGRYIKVEEQLYSEDCTQRCWCHPLGGVICEKAVCSPGQRCALRNGAWGCHDRLEVCELKDSLQVSSLSGQQMSLEPKLSYSLMSLCDRDSEQWFSLISYYGPCNQSSTRLVTVFQILLQGSSIAIEDGVVKVNGLLVSLPHILPSGVSLSSGVTQDRTEVIVIFKRDAGMDSELEMEICVTMVTIKVSPWYSGKLCGLCGNIDKDPDKSVKSWVLPDFQACGPTE